MAAVEHKQKKFLGEYIRAPSTNLRDAEYTPDGRGFIIHGGTYAPLYFGQIRKGYKHGEGWSIPSGVRDLATTTCQDWSKEEEGAENPTDMCLASWLIHCW